MTAKCRAVLIHVVENILQVAPDDPLHWSTIGRGFNSISDLLSLSDADIASLIYTDTATGSKKPLQVFKKNRIKILKAWNQYLLVHHAIERVDWMDKSGASLEAYSAFWGLLYDPDNPNP